VNELDDTTWEERPPGDSARLRQLGMWLFLAALTMLFAAGMLGYVLIRARAGGPPAGSIRLPAGLWVSTVIIVTSSLCIQQAVQAARTGTPTQLRRWLSATWMLALGFLAVQIPCMVILLKSHKGLPLYGLLFFLILLHAAHVLGGLVALGAVSIGSARAASAAARFGAVKRTAMYWHFLDGVWIVMFAVFLASR